MYCCRDMQNSVFVCIIAHVLQLSGGSDENANIPCRLSRKSFHTGFHRTVETAVNCGTIPANCDCVILLKELLPSGLYVDTYQTDSLHQHGAAKVYSLKDIDLEQPEYASQSHEIFVFKNATNSDGDGLIHAELSLPVHLRYHQPREDADFLSVSLQSPVVMLQCATCTQWFSKLKQDRVTAPCSHDTSMSCAWLQLQHTGGQELSFDVPVGQLGHILPVTIMTMFVTLTSTVVLIAVMCRTPSGGSAKNKT